jgi:hypothetical protein
MDVHRSENHERACFGSKFVVSRTGEAYDARVRDPNQKF